MKWDEEGVHAIANTENPDRVADVVFVHGLHGASHSTWTYGEKGSSDYFFWPEQLGPELPDCGIWSVGYSAGITVVGKPGMLIEKRSRNLVSQFGLSKLGERPIIFICHSMGGLIIKDLAVRGSLPSDTKHSQLVKNIKGIIFCGTPHRGSAIASMASFLRVAQKHVRQMTGNEEALDLAHEQFLNWLGANPVEVMTFAESYPLMRQTFWGRFMPIPRVLIVPRASANPNVGRIHDIDADHLSLVKPKGKDLIFGLSLEWLGMAVASIKKEASQTHEGGLDSSPVSAPQSLRHSEASALFIDLGNEKEERLKVIQKKLSEGHFAAAEKDVRTLMANASVWSVLQHSTRAKAYRALIHAVINRQAKTAGAKTLLSQAKAECPNERFVTSEALIAITEGNEKAMLESYPSPVTEQEWRWKLLLLVNDEQYEEAIRIALDPAAPFPCSTTVHSCLTWAYLKLKNLDKAHQSNQLALESEPHSLGNLEAKALIEYASAISPHASAWLASAYPIPLAVECVYTTAEAVRHFEKAAELFEDFATRMDVGSEQQLRYLLWSLACWCNLARINPSLGSAPVEKCLAIFHQIQTLQPGSSLSIHWALLAELPVDLVQIENTCHAILANGEIESVEILRQLYQHQGKEAEAAELMDRFKEAFSIGQSSKGWRFSRIQLAGALQQTETVRTILSEAEDEEERIQLLAFSLRLPALRGDCKEECLKAYVDLWTHSGKVTDLFSACEMHVRLDSPEFVVEHVDRLLREFPGKRTLEMVLTALNEAGKWEQSLRILNEYRSLVNDENSDVFLQIESEACFQKGDFQTALSLIKQIIQKHPNQQNILLWFNKSKEAGDHLHMIEAAQRVLQTGECPAQNLLHMADHLTAVHIQLARQLFRAAVATPQIHLPHTAAYTFILANKLNLADELAPEVMQSALSPAGPMKRFTMDEVSELMREKQSVRAEQEEHYRLGRVHVHAYADVTGHPLSAIVHDACPPANGDYFAAPTRLWSARLRHGRRYHFSEPPPSSPWKLHLDITSLLVAHRLGMLDVLEKSEAQLSISPKIPGLLLEEMKQLADRQPSREREVDQLLVLIDAGRIRVTSQSQSEIPGLEAWASGMTQNWKSAFSAAVEGGGVLIDFWPLDWDFEPGKPLDVPEKLLQHVGGPSGLVQGMIDAGWIEEEELRPKIHSHNSFHPASPSVRLEHLSTIILDTEIARSLMNVGALDSLITRCKVWITYEEEQRCREAQRQAKYQNEVLAGIDSLQKHLQGELGRRYQTGPVSSHAVRHERESLLFNSVLDLLAVTSGALIVSEDRWMTGFLFAGEAPIVGLLDVLYWLHKVHRLSASEFFGCLHRMRLGNARFIPLCKEELLFRLKGATNLHTKELRETPELEVIRRYYAACFLDAKSMQFSKAGDVDSTEIGFLTQILISAASVFADLWTHEDDKDIRDNKAQWLLHALVTDVGTLAMKQLHPQAEPERYRDRTLSDLFCFFCLQIWEQQRSDLDMLTERTSGFAKWLIKSLRLRAREYHHFCEAIKSMVNQIHTEHPEAGAGQGMIPFATSIILGLMNVGHGHVSLSQEEREQFGIDQVMLLGGFHFERRSVWDAIERAMSGGAVTVVSQCGQREYQVSWAPNPQGLPDVSFSSGADGPLHYRSGDAALASPEMPTRISFLQARRSDIDLSQEKAQTLFPSIAALASPSDRIDQYDLLQEESTTLQFRRFLNRPPEATIRISHIEKEARPLGCASLLRHAGLEPGMCLQRPLFELMTEAAPQLMEDYEMADAFARQGSLPVRLPEIWAVRIFSLSATELDAFVRSFEAPVSNPFLRLQLACLLLRPDSPAQERGKALLDSLIGDVAKESWSYFNAVLRWSWRCLAARNEDFAPEEMWLCAWVHAGILQFWLPRPPQSPEVIAAFNRLELVPASLFENREVIPDVVHPLHFSAKWLLLHALPQLISLDRLSAPTADSLTELYRTLLFTSKDAPTPETSMPVLRADWTNRLGTFLASASVELLKDWVTVEQQIWINQKTVLGKLQRHCEHVELSNSAESWKFLSLALNLQPAPEALSSAFHIQMEAFDVSKLRLSEEHKAEELWGISYFITKQRSWYRTADEIYWMKLLNEFFDRLEKEGDPNFEAHAVDLAFSMEFAYGDTPSECAARFADTVIQMVRKRPAIATKTWEALSQIVMAQNPENQHHLWPMLAEVRALGGRP
ncbi:hypothetical protein EI77_00102 [Prosthecobacter fusiformis]|uniref:Uncharacterized protein n=1 Tax=Prosthecobacter fusiformis TaxID=48464 RepID=A0A4R7SQ87_9BACT|nr:hypothetical protein [Prosthecobacter fusiformis]TDU80805.1 hypothetical protein EI77_00102 [Prosthecobacter fusiformis]